MHQSAGHQENLVDSEHVVKMLEHYTVFLLIQQEIACKETSLLADFFESSVTAENKDNAEV